MECILQATEHQWDLYYGSWWIYFRIFESGLVFYFRPQNFHSVQYSIHTTLIHQIINMFTQSFKSHFHNIVSRHCVCDTLSHVNCILFSILEKINIQYFSKLKKLMGLCFCVTVIKRTTVSISPPRNIPHYGTIFLAGDSTTLQFHQRMQRCSCGVCSVCRVRSPHDHATSRHRALATAGHSSVMTSAPTRISVAVSAPFFSDSGNGPKVSLLQNVPRQQQLLWKVKKIFHQS